MKQIDVVKSWAGYPEQIARVDDLETKLALENEQRLWVRSRNWFASIQDASDVIYCQRTGQPIGLITPHLARHGFTTIAPQWLKIDPKNLRTMIEQEPISHLAFVFNQLLNLTPIEGVSELDKIENRKIKLIKFYYWAIETIETPGEYNAISSALAILLELFRAEVKISIKVDQMRKLFQEILTKPELLEAGKKDLISLSCVMAYGLLTKVKMPNELEEIEEVIETNLRAIRLKINGDKTGLNYILAQETRKKSKATRTGSQVFKRTKEAEKIANKLEGLF